MKTETKGDVDVMKKNKNLVTLFELAYKNEVGELIDYNLGKINVKKKKENKLLKAIEKIKCKVVDLFSLMKSAVIKRFNINVPNKLLNMSIMELAMNGVGEWLEETIKIKRDGVDLLNLFDIEYIDVIKFGDKVKISKLKLSMKTSLSEYRERNLDDIIYSNNGSIEFEMKNSIRAPFVLFDSMKQTQRLYKNVGLNLVTCDLSFEQNIKIPRIKGKPIENEKLRIISRN